MESKKNLILTIAILTALIAENALANDGTPPWIHALIQSDNTNMNITLGIVDSGEPGINDSYRLGRDGPEGAITVIDDTTFNAADASEMADRCRGGVENIEYCKSNPNDCLDCDGDEVLECSSYHDGWCEKVFYFEVIDWCVPAGETTYSLQEVNATWTEDEETKIVEAWTGECDPPATDTDTDSDTEVGTEPDNADDSGDGGCNIVEVETSSNTDLASILILFI